MTYDELINRKRISVAPSGFDVDIAALNQNAFEWQKSVTKWALSKGRCALFEDCGCGKTIQFLSWAQKVHERTGGDILILSPLAVSHQTIREGAKFGIDVHLCASQADVRAGINVTNYEKRHAFDPTHFVGVVLDESSILKAYTGKTKQELVKMFRDTPYKLAATATPAPNDLMELLNHAEFLGVMKSSEALAIWFMADQSESGKYRLKGHAAKDFWRWVASWAVCISKPSDIGFSDDGYILPPLAERDVIIDVSEFREDMTGGMFRDIDMSSTGYHKEKVRTLKDRCRATAEMAQGDEQFVIWTYRDDEANELKRLLPEAVEVRGSHKPEYKERAAIDFVDGNTRILISKPTIYGYGLNLQNCHNVIFNGLDYSYESYYQAVRRFYRFGQKNTVNVWRVLGSTERHILDVQNGKQAMRNDMMRSMAEAMRNFQTEAVQGRTFKISAEKTKISCPPWLRSEVA